MKKYVATLGVTLVVIAIWQSSALFAQPHPCDAPPVGSGTATTGIVQIGWCHDKKSTNGSAITVSAWELQSDSVSTTLTNVTTNNVANASGLVYYQTGVNFPQQGNFTVTITGFNGSLESTPSVPFALSVSAPSAPPTSPSRVRSL